LDHTEQAPISEHAIPAVRFALAFSGLGSHDERRMREAQSRPLGRAAPGGKVAKRVSVPPTCPLSLLLQSARIRPAAMRIAVSAAIPVLLLSAVE
jgi:hypothetical protein